MAHVGVSTTPMGDENKIQKDSSKKSIKSNASHGKKKKILSVITS